MARIKPRARLENWCVVSVNGASRYYGAVYGHPKYPNGTPICTTTTKIHEDGSVESDNTIYVLGVFSPEVQAQMNANGLKAEYN